MKILIIGDCGHQLLLAFIRSLKRFTNIDFYAFSIAIVKPDDAKYYRGVQYAKTFGSIYKHRIFRKFVYAFEIIFLFSNLKQRFHFTHIHLAKVQYLFIWPLIKRKSEKVAISVWGSEFLRASRFKKLLLGFMYKRADFVHCTNKGLRNSLINEFNLLPSKVLAVPFFLENLKSIDDVRMSKQVVKSDLNWANNKISIVIGYNYNEGQQHLLIISELLGLSRTLQNSIQFVFPLTYGNNIHYKERVISKASELHSTPIFYTSFLSDIVVSRIRLAGDIFVNLQVTDQYSASFVESLYSGNIVITGSWLPYNVLRDAGVYFIDIDSVGELNSAIKYIIDNLEFMKMKAEDNKRIISDIFDEEKLAFLWCKLYQSPILASV